MRNRTKKEFEQAYEFAKERALKHVKDSMMNRPRNMDDDRLFIEALYMVMGSMSVKDIYAGVKGSDSIRFDMIEDLRESVFQIMIG